MRYIPLDARCIEPQSDWFRNWIQVDGNEDELARFSALLAKGGGGQLEYRFKLTDAQCRIKSEKEVMATTKRGIHRGRFMCPPSIARLEEMGMEWFVDCAANHLLYVAMHVADEHGNVIQEHWLQETGNEREIERCDYLLGGTDAKPRRVWLDAMYPRTKPELYDMYSTAAESNCGGSDDTATTSAPTWPPYMYSGTFTCPSSLRALGMCGLGAYFVTSTTKRY